ncbi:MAG: tyrosine-type recombinase/integrase [Defluviitaleaceae bacterium]|nr:tyrosine-type recombinase/integrase [Defluviitaleaceae bacterium]
MKYNILNDFRRYLNNKYNKNTADTYYFAVDKILKNHQFGDLSEVNFGSLGIDKIKGNKNEFSAIKNGLKNLNKFSSDFKIPKDDFFKEISKKKRNFIKSKGKEINLDKTRRKINATKNDKYKLAFRLAMVSGLRVSELSQLSKKDLKIDSDANKIDVFIERGKGGKKGNVLSMEDPYLCQKLSGYIEKLNNGDKIFPAKQSLKNKAKSLGIEMHDLRRIFAITYRKNLMNEGVGILQANEATQNALRHTRFSTTKRYLFNKKLRFKR